MGLFGALFAGVSGLDSQSNKIGIISNNISNVNTVGYKQGQASFDTLVVPSGTTSFSPGGVIGNNQQLVNQQGIISATTSATDVAISGGGLLVVNTKADGTGNTYYTRAGSFTQDANGDFVNANNYFLQGLPIGADGTTAQANTQNLTTVSISQSASGAATATSTLGVAANLNATQAVLQGPGETTAITSVDTINATNTGAQIIVPTGAGGNNLTVGNTIQVLSTGTSGTLPTTYTYGGFTFGRDVTATIDSLAASTGNAAGSGGTLLDTQSSANNISTGVAGSNTVTITLSGNAADYVVGNYLSISGINATTGGIPANKLDGEWQILTKVGNTLTVDVGANSTGVATATATISNRTFPFQGNVLDATTDGGDFLAKSGTAPFATDALAFTITTGGTTHTFTYNAVPNTSQGQFNSLTTLAQAVSDAPGLTASVVGHQIYVSATDADQAVTFNNVDRIGNNTGFGINWTQELGLANIAQAAAGSNTFNSLSGLSALLNTDPNLTSTVNNPTSSAPSIGIHESNPLQTIEIKDGPLNGAGGSIVSELGLKGINGSALSDVTVGVPNILTTGILPATYQPTDNTRNMSSGAVAPQFSKDITVFDAQGNGHTLALNFAKLNTNTWAVEAAVIPASEVRPASSDGQVAFGTLIFGGDGSLTSATGTIASPQGFTINWTNGANSSTITMNLGVGGSTGLVQTAGAFNFSAANQNGSPVGELTGVSIDANGFVIASFSNGQTQKIYQTPLASVSNPDGLEAVSGNAYIQTLASGIANLQLAGTSGVGTFTPSALEQSNVDLSTQLTNLIVAQQAYGANSKVLTVADQLLQQLDQIIQ